MQHPPHDDWFDDSESFEAPPQATEPSGDLNEPPRNPPTTVATFAAPEPRPPRPPHRWRGPARTSRVMAAVNAALDVLDGIGDAVRTAAARAMR